MEALVLVFVEVISSTGLRMQDGGGQPLDQSIFGLMHTWRPSFRQPSDFGERLGSIEQPALRLREVSTRPIASFLNKLYWVGWSHVKRSNPHPCPATITGDVQGSSARPLDKPGYKVGPGILQTTWD